MSVRHRGRGTRADNHPDLLTPTLERLRRTPRPWVVENVPGAARAMRTVIILHGGMFGLRVYRPRLFESSVLLWAPPDRGRPARPIGVYGRRPDGRLLTHQKDGPRAARSVEEARQAMGIDWMDWRELCEAIPPAYTEWIGRQLLAAVCPPLMRCAR
jgi:DNA (cytosine-5)-methyltransferase 1